MWSRIAIVVTATFWIAMMTLLWRSEFGDRRPFGASVPVATVWNRILTAPDASTLEIRRGTNQIGQCQLRADIGQAVSSLAYDEFDESLEGMISQVTYYRLDLDGTLFLPELSHRARFGFMIKLDTNRVWQEFLLNINFRPDIYELSGNAVEQRVRIHVDAGGDKFDRSFHLSELRNPQRILTEIGGPALPLLLGMMGAGSTTTSTNLFDAIGMKWEAENDSLLMGRSSVRVFRISTTVLGRYHANLYVSPVGEVLRAELPNNIVLLNNSVPALRRLP